MTHLAETTKHPGMWWIGIAFLILIVFRTIAYWIPLEALRLRWENIQGMFRDRRQDRVFKKSLPTHELIDTNVDAIELLRINIDVDATTYGWAAIHICTADRTHDIVCSDIGGDTLSKLASAFESLILNPVKKVEVWSDGEPELVNLRLVRRENVLEIAIKRFKDEFDGVPGKLIARALKSNKPRLWEKVDHARNKRVALRCHGSFARIAKTLTESFDLVLSRLGSDCYEKHWGYAPPAESLETIRAFISDQPAKE